MDEPSGQSLDPFEFHGHPASCIAGLGGSVPLPDPSYAFHTPYVPVARGHAHFLVRFANLQARRGSLVLRVHMLPDEPGATAQLVTSHRVQLNWLAHHGGETQLRFEAFRGARYALMGVVPDQLDAHAEGLSIILDRPATAEDLAITGDVAEARSTIFGSATVKPVPVPLLLSLDAPSFAQPVSQPCTAKQMRETTFRDRCRSLGLPTDTPEDWQRAYAVQALDRYGMMQPGARGLMLGQDHAVVRRALEAAGASCHRLSLRDTSSQGEPADGFTIDPATLPGELYGFDFLLSIRVTDGLGDGRTAALFLEQTMECLRPGGLAVHMMGYHPASSTIPTVTFDRNGLERVAVALISRGHQVARMKPALAQHRVMAGEGGVVPFGLITQRAALIR
ncbi:hypothetical protein SAMN05192583_3217 [Sphingomonas gellani]|uniref:Methyltransferase domain-containing protein n=1 Tax=Sphingomonas gellani TaxID=1166340 RepID=A0A1H8I6M8_9SPHN|nr:hypothetical protein [Sphingomonas gellani]SEN63775.1 hypothetical protein SAMN05192583_3217 [Sphingomonas gellani]